MMKLENKPAPEWCIPVDRSTATGIEIPLYGQRQPMIQVQPVAMDSIFQELMAAAESGPYTDLESAASSRSRPRCNAIVVVDVDWR